MSSEILSLNQMILYKIKRQEREWHNWNKKKSSNNKRQVRRKFILIR